MLRSSNIIFIIVLLLATPIQLATASPLNNTKSSNSNSEPSYVSSLTTALNVVAQISSNMNQQKSSGINLNKLLDAVITDKAQDGLLLINRKNAWNNAPENHYDIIECVDIDSVWKSNYSGFGIVTEINQTENIYGEDSNYTSYYEGYFNVSNPGTWYFAIDSDGSSEIEIDEQVVVGWYGEHLPSKDWSHNGSIYLDTGWHRFILRYVRGEGEVVTKVAFKDPDDTEWRVFSTQRLDIRAYYYDLDGDGLPNSLESILGTDPENIDSDSDQLSDYYEAKNGLDPLKPDSNDDGLIDYLEVTDVDSDVDNDGFPNAWDIDNDGDGVPDSLDPSPFAKSKVYDTFHFDIKTNGSPTSIDFQIRPKDSKHLKIPQMTWDWPKDDKGNMRDIDSSTQDVRIIPMLELTANYLPEQSEVEKYGIIISKNKKVGSFDGKFTKNDGLAVGDVNGDGKDEILIAGDVSHKVGIFSGDGSKLKQFDGKFTKNDGFAVGDLDGDGKAEILVAHDINHEILIFDANGNKIGGFDKADFATRYDKLAIGDVFNDYKDKIDTEVLVACANDNSYEVKVNYYEKWWKHRNGWRQYQLNLGFTEDDGFAVGDVNGDGKDEILVANDENHLVTIFNGKGKQLAKFDGKFTKNDGFAVGDVNGDGKDEILVVGDIDHTVKIFDINGSKISEFECGFSTGDGFAVGDVYGTGKDVIVVARHLSGVVEIFSLGGREKAYVPLTPVQDYGLTTAFQGQMFYPATNKPLNLSFDARLVWFVKGANDDFTAKDEIIVAGDISHKVEIFGLDGNRVNRYDSKFSTGDGFAVGDVNGDGRDEVVVGDKKDHNIYIYSGGGELLKTIYLDSSDGFTKNDGLAVGDVNRDGKEEIIIAHDIDHDIFIYYGNGTFIRRINLDEDYGFEKDNGFAVGDTDGDGEDEIVIGKKGSKGYEVIIYSGEGNKLKQFNVYEPIWSNGFAVGNVLSWKGDEILLAYSTYPSEECKLVIYSGDGSYRKVLHPNVNFTKESGFAVGNIYGKKDNILISNAKDGKISIYSGDGKLLDEIDDKFSKNDGLAIGDVAEGKSNYDITLAKYREDFMLTGFNVEEDYGCDVGLFYGEDINETSKAYIVLRYEFLNSQNSLSDASDKLTENNVSVNHTIKSFSYSYEALENMVGNLTNTVLDSLPDDKQLPIIFAIRGVTASKSMESFINSTNYILGSNYNIDLTSVKRVTMKSLKMGWYDTTTNEHLDSKEIIDIVENWNWSREKKENAIMLFLAWDIGEGSMTKIGYDETTLEPPEKPETLKWIAASTMSLQRMVLSPIYLHAVSYFFIKWKIRGFSFWKSHKIARKYFKLLSSSKLIYSEGRIGGLPYLKKIMGKELPRDLLNKFSKNAKWANRLKIAGLVASGASIAYVVYQIGSQTGWSNFGRALASVYAALQVMYGAIFWFLEWIGPVGWAIEAIIILSDLLCWIITGESWTEKAMKWIIDELTDLNVRSKVDLDIQSTWIDTSDYDDNGIDVGDRIQFRCRVKEEVELTDDGEKEDLDESYIYSKINVDNLVLLSDRGDIDEVLSSKKYKSTKRKIHIIGAWLEPEKPQINLRFNFEFSTYYRVFYEECCAGSCDRKSKGDSYNYETTLYYDIMPETLDDFLKWMPNPLDRDGDGLLDSIEKHGHNLYRIINKGSSDDKNEDCCLAGSASGVYVDYKCNDGSADLWRFEYAGDGWTRIISQRAKEWVGEKKTCYLYVDKNAYPEVDIDASLPKYSKTGNYSLWRFKDVEGGYRIINKGSSDDLDKRCCLYGIEGVTNASNPYAGVEIDCNCSNNYTLWKIEPVETTTSRSNPDTDKDGLSDKFEIDHLKDYGTDPIKKDTDGDGLTDKEELIIGTDPIKKDTDGDGLTDGKEYEGWQISFTYCGEQFKMEVSSNPLLADTDDDGLNDSAEFNLKYNPNSKDTDGDGISDINDDDLHNSPSWLEDTDNDGLANETETNGWDVEFTNETGKYIISVTSDPEVNDTDSDGLTDKEEFRFTNPRSNDTDNDGVSDYNESMLGTDPTHYDTDLDKISDGDEIRGWNITITNSTGNYTIHVESNPVSKDSDSDGINDSLELELGSDPQNVDTDSDGLSDYEELELGTNITNYDTDNDGLDDGTEIVFGSDPKKNDTDNDGVSDAEEFNFGSNPNSNDTDGDGLSDLEEKNINTSLTMADTDGDKLSDYDEYKELGTDPLKFNTDYPGDSLSDGYEVLYFGSDPLDGDSDDDGLSDSEEWYYKTDPLDPDTDDDGLTDYIEVKSTVTDPLTPDTDGDKIKDGLDLTSNLTNLTLNEILVLYDEVNESGEEFIEELSKYINVTSGTLEEISNYTNYTYIIMLGMPNNITNDTVEALIYNLTTEEEREKMNYSDIYRFATSVKQRLPEWYENNDTESNLEKLGLENSIVVMLTNPYRGDPYRALGIIKQLKEDYWDNLVIKNYTLVITSFSVDAIKNIDFNLSAELNSPVLPPSSVAVMKYNNRTVPYPLTYENGLENNETAVEKYYEIVVTPNINNIKDVHLQIYYTALDLDRSPLKDGDCTDFIDINESTLSLYYWNETTEEWTKIASIVNTTNVELYGGGYEGYVEADVTHLGMFGLAAKAPPIPIPPEIVSFSPNSTVKDVISSDLDATYRTFNITVNQTAKVSWYMDGAYLFMNESVTNSSCTLLAEVGMHNITAYVENINGSDKQSWIWEVRTPPEIIIYSPLNASYANPIIDLNVSAKEEIDTWWYSLNNGSNITFIPNITINAPEGSNHIVVYANNSLGDIGDSDVYFTIDTVKPEIIFVNPTPENNSVVTVDYVYINVTSNEDLDTALVEWDDSNYSMQNNGSSWYLNMTNLANGNYTYKVYANDSSGNMNVTETRVVTINYTPPDTTPPNIDFVAPTPDNNSILNRDYVYINITSNENLGIAILEWNGTNYTMDGYGRNWHINRTGLGNGNYTYRVYGNDSAGNQNITETRVVIINIAQPDITPPQIIFVPPTPENNSVLDRNYVYVNITANEDLNTALLEWNDVNYSMQGSGKNWHLNKTGLVNGNYTFKVYANDSSGNLNVTESRTVVINVTQQDTTPPTIVFVDPTPENNSVLDRNYVYINITSNEDLNVALLEWNGSNHTMQGSGSNYHLNMTNLANGNYAYKVYGNDSSGNMNISETRTVVINKTNKTSPDNPPTIQNLTAKNITLTKTSGNYTTISWNASDDRGIDQQWVIVRYENGSILNKTFSSSPVKIYIKEYGEYNATVYVNDTSGNLAKKSTLFYATLVLENNKTVNSTETTVINESEVVIKAQAEENASIQVALEVKVSKDSGTFGVVAMDNDEREGLRYIEIKNKSKIKNITKFRVETPYTQEEKKNRELYIMYYNGSEWFKLADYVGRDIPDNKGGLHVYSAGDTGSSVYAEVNHTSIFGLGGSVVTTGTTPTEVLGEYTPEVTILANSIDLNLAQEFVAYLENNGITVYLTDKTNFSDYNNKLYIIILGGQEAPEGVGEIVSEILTEEEKTKVKQAKAWIKKTSIYRAGQVIYILAGKDRGATAEAWKENKGEVMKVIKYNWG